MQQKMGGQVKKDRDTQLSFTGQIIGTEASKEHTD